MTYCHFCVINIAYAAVFLVIKRKLKKKHQGGSKDAELQNSLCSGFPSYQKKIEKKHQGGSKDAELQNSQRVYI